AVEGHDEVAAAPDAEHANEAIEPVVTELDAEPASDEQSETQSGGRLRRGRGKDKDKDKGASAVGAPASATAAFPADFKGPIRERSGPPLGELLVEKGKLTRDQLDEALFAQKDSGEMLGA